MKQLSVFDIIGPNMIGPSSSHTAGAAKIAKMAYSLKPKNMTKVTFILYESFALTYRGHGTDRALLAGILGMNEDDENLKDAYDIADKAGLNYEFKVNTEEHTRHPNTVDIIMESADGNNTSIRGVSLGGGAIMIERINNIEVMFTGEYHTLIVNHQDKPGTAAHITNILGKWKINIAYMRIYREHKGTNASTIIEADEPICEDVLDEIEANSLVDYAQIIS